MVSNKIPESLSGGTLDLKNLILPPISRSHMLYREYRGHEDTAPDMTRGTDERGTPAANKWIASAFFRRVMFLALVSASVYLNVSIMFGIMKTGGFNILKWACLTVFTFLIGWIAANFWILVGGFLTAVSGYNPFNVRNVLKGNNVGICPDTMTAVLFPICNENIAEVFSRIRTVYVSLQNTGEIQHFHFFILSDTANPDKMVGEEVAWERICRDVNGFGRVFYRRRNVRLKMKYGNIADFCKRWGKNYKYMVIMDSDSLMSGNLLCDLTKIMEARPDIGILQTPPQSAGRETLHSRINQFVNHLCGPLYFAGLHFLRLGDAEFWGHNAIVRVMPYMKYCALPKYRGRAPFGGEIFSHDFVEAAFMRRAGWSVWIGFDLRDSYEQIPPNLPAELERDYRWCQGNLQHLRFIFMKGISWGHRFMFLNGNMFYFSYIFWLSLLIMINAQGLIDLFRRVDYYPGGSRYLFPAWPEYHLGARVFLIASTGVYLLAAKILGLINVVLTRRLKYFGGIAGLSASVASETVYSAMVAPIKMMFISGFILRIFSGKKITWDVSDRDEKTISFKNALSIYGTSTFAAFFWAALLFFMNRSMFYGFSFVLMPVCMAIPVTMIFSMAGLGIRARGMGLFVIPEEVEPSAELKLLARFRSEYSKIFEDFEISSAGFLRILEDKSVSKLHLELIPGSRTYSKSISLWFSSVVERAAGNGAGSLSLFEKKAILRNGVYIKRLADELDFPSFPRACP